MTSPVGESRESAIMTAPITKTDSDVRADVEEELHWELNEQASEIGVTVRDGVVTLSGQVKSFWEKWSAERAVERVVGVRAVANDIEVPLGSERTDSDIAQHVANVLDWSSPIPRGQVKAEVEKGWVTLRGEVGADYQRRAPERLVRHVRGVRGITNAITIKPRANPIDVKVRIENSFRS
jgi:osmotically-inducible protein OsmY